MSITSRHTVVPFIAGETKAMSGQRLAKVGYKTTEKTPAKYPSVAASVPHLAVADIRANLDQLLPHIGTMLENAQDGIFRSLYESKDGSLRELSDDDISVESCIAWLDAEATGDRLKKDDVLRWFDRTLAEPVYMLVAEKLRFTENDVPTPEQDKVIQGHVKIYREVFGILAGGKTVLAEKQIRGCKTALSLVEDDSISVKLVAKLAAMEKKPELADMLELS